jgi:hypothetical protein
MPKLLRLPKSLRPMEGPSRLMVHHDMPERHSHENSYLGRVPRKLARLRRSPLGGFTCGLLLGAVVMVALTLPRTAIVKDGRARVAAVLRGWKVNETTAAAADGESATEAEASAPGPTAGGPPPSNTASFPIQSAAGTPTPVPATASLVQAPLPGKPLRNTTEREPAAEVRHHESADPPTVPSVDTSAHPQAPAVPAQRPHRKKAGRHVQERVDGTIDTSGFASEGDDA